MACHKHQVRDADNIYGQADLKPDGQLMCDSGNHMDESSISLCNAMLDELDRQGSPLDFITFSI